MENGQPTLCDIPWEDVVFPLIFSNLSYQDLVNLEVAFPEYDDLIDCYFSQLKTVEWETVTPDDLQVLSQKTSSLRQLDLACNKWLRDGVLKEFIQKNKNLVSLNVCSCPYLSERGVQPIMNLKLLTSLSVRRNFWVTNSFVDLLTSNLECLEEIDLAMCMVDDTSLVPFFKKFKRLKSIDLEAVPFVSNPTLYAIAENCKELITINLRGNKRIGEDSVRSIVSSCKKLLTMLVLGCVKLSANFLAWLENMVLCDAS